MVSIILFLLVASTSAFAIPNPAVVYCEELGYKIKVNETPLGEQGICVIKENVTEYDSWDFFEGKVGKDYSFCAKHDYGIETATDGKNTFSPEYAVCIIKKSYPSGPSISSVKEEKIAVIDLMNLTKIYTEIKPLIKTEENESKITSTSTISSTSIPSYFDWRNVNGSNWLTPIRDQRGCGSCWAFAAIGAMEAKIKITRNDSNFDTNLAEQDIVSCSSAGSCSGGWSDAALNYIKNNGTVDESCFPYNAKDESCSNKCSTWNKRLWYIDDYGYISDVQKAKNYIVEKGPVVAYIGMSGYFDANKIYRCDGTPSQNHAIVIVGYNDTGGYWIAKNSWVVYGILTATLR